MLGIPLRYVLRHPVQAVKDLAEDPLEAWTTIQETYLAEREQGKAQCPYECDGSWESRLHGYLGLGWPCKSDAEFWPLWVEVTKELEAKGVHAGPKSFLSWNDGDAAFVRTIWCLTRFLRPKIIVETGVAHGVTSRFILAALERNGQGHLYSIDLPPLERAWRKQVAIAVGDRYADRWTYIKGSSRRRLPGLISELGVIDLFIHDSLHSERNVRFEMENAWRALRPGGALVVDDVDANWGFRSFTQDNIADKILICEAEPLRPDTRRFNQKGLFGIILKQGAARPRSRAAGA